MPMTAIVERSQKKLIIVFNDSSDSWQGAVNDPSTAK